MQLAIALQSQSASTRRAGRRIASRDVACASGDRIVFLRNLLPVSYYDSHDESIHSVLLPMNRTGMRWIVLSNGFGETVKPTRSWRPACLS